MKYGLALALISFCFAAAGCGGADIAEKKTYRLLAEELRFYKEAYTNPNVVLYEQPEQAEEYANTEGKFIYLGWLSNEGSIAGNPWRDTEWNRYRASRNPDLSKIDADMWWILEKRRESLQIRKKQEASRPRVLSY